MKFSLFMALTVLWVGTISLVGADPRGDTWARQYHGLKDAKDSSEQMTMVIVNKQGAKKIRKLEVSSRELADGTKQSFMKFLDPADVVGMKFLSSKPKGGETDQSLWLPALGKVRKISSSGKDGDFFNSDFNYYDMEEREFQDAAYTLLAENETLPDAAFSGMKFAKVQFVPTTKEAPYSRSIYWINQENNFPYRIDTYDKKDDSLMKTILAFKVESFDGVLISTQISVTNLKRGSKTLVQINQVKINQGVNPDLFTQKNLEK